MRQFSYETTRDIAARTKMLENLVREMARFASLITCRYGNMPDMRFSELPSKGIRRGNVITVNVDGRDEEAAVAAIQNYIVAHF